MTREENLYQAYKAVVYESENVNRCAKHALNDEDYEGFIKNLKRVHRNYMAAYNDFLIAANKTEDKQ